MNNNPQRISNHPTNISHVLPTISMAFANKLHDTRLSCTSRNHIDLTQNALIALLYNDASSITFESFLNDVDIATHSSKLTTTLDKICASKQLDNMIKSTQPNTNTQTQFIINHTLQENNRYGTDIIDAYAHGYRLVHDNDMITESDNVQFASENGYYIKKVSTCILIARCSHDHRRMHEILPCNTIKKLYIRCSINPTLLEKCTSVTHLDICTQSSDLVPEDCAPFAKSLRKLHALCGIHDDGLKRCTMIEELCANFNDKITTCAPFAKSLKILYASHTCGINDAGLKLCTSIELLNANNNMNITTCAPFAKTLRILAIRKYKKCKCAKKCKCSTKHYGMCDDGIQQCTNIRKLYACSNQDITTCKPFGKSLVMLTACYECGISCDELCRYSSLQDVYGYGNEKIVRMCNKMRTRGVNIHTNVYIPMFYDVGAGLRYD